MNNKKKVVVVFENEKLKQEYENILDNDILKKRIDYIIERIQENPSFGQPIKKELIPKEYKNK